MNRDHRVTMHTVHPTPCGKFAVVDSSGVTLADLHCEALAIMVAAELDREPVRDFSAVNETASPRGVAPVGRWDRRAA